MDLDPDRVERWVERLNVLVENSITFSKPTGNSTPRWELTSFDDCVFLLFSGLAEDRESAQAARVKDYDPIHTLMLTRT